MSTLAPFVPFVNPLDFLAASREITEAFLRAFRGVTLAPVMYRRNFSSLRLGEQQQAQMTELMAPVMRIGPEGQYIGAVMTLERTLLAAAMSGDYNDVHINPDRPHPLFGRLIAHGMDAVTQAFAALRLDIGRRALVPVKAEISFRQPVFLDQDHLWIHVATPPGLPRERVIQVFALGRKADPARLVVRIRVSLQLGPCQSELIWFRSLMAAWRISALLAETWPGCLYAKQVLFFRQPLDMDDSLGISLRGEGANEKGQCLVSTQAHGSGQFTDPQITGQATIALPAA